MGKTALDGKRLNAFLMNPLDLTIVGRDTKDGVEHPLFDERAKFPPDEAMVRNIRRYGVLEPVIVRKNGDLVEIVDGRQRVICTREAARRNIEEGLPEILVPCVVRKGVNSDLLGVMISGNEIRRDDDPLVRAAKAQRLISFGASEQEVADAFGLTKGAVKNLLSILDLSEKVQDTIKSGKISFTAATQLRDLTHKEQDEKIDELVAKGATGVAESRRLSRERRATKEGKEPPAPRGKAVSVAVLRKVVADEEFVATLSPDAKAILQWIVGDEGASRRVKGLTALLKG